MNTQLESIALVVTGLDFDAQGINDCASQLLDFSKGIEDPAAKQAWKDVADQFAVVAANMQQRKTELSLALQGLRAAEAGHSALQREIDAAPVVEVVWEGFEGEHQRGTLEPRSTRELERFIGKRMKLIEDKG